MCVYLLVFGQKLKFCTLVIIVHPVGDINGDPKESGFIN